MKIGLVHIFLLLSLSLSARQFSNDSIPAARGRQWIAGGGTALAYASSMTLLSQAWYKDYPRSSFHSYNDGAEWMQIDKIGHAWTAYNASRLGYGIWKWAGSGEKSAVWLGTGSSLAFMLTIEYFDGRSAEWGWSWPDVGADLSGAALFASQQLLLRRQDFNLKWSGTYRKYEGELQQRADALFGKSIPERILKDYNTQTYWLSYRLHSLIPSCPSWLNVSFGYGADGMFGGYSNLSVGENGNIEFDRRDIARYRQWYLAPDVDLTQIRTRSKLLRSLFAVMNSVKFPAPALSYSKKGFRFKAIAF